MERERERKVNNFRSIAKSLAKTGKQKKSKEKKIKVFLYDSFESELFS